MSNETRSKFRSKSATVGIVPELESLSRQRPEQQQGQPGQPGQRGQQDFVSQEGHVASNRARSAGSPGPQSKPVYGSGRGRSARHSPLTGRQGTRAGPRSTPRHSPAPPQVVDTGNWLRLWLLAQCLYHVARACQREHLVLALRDGLVHEPCVGTAYQALQRLIVHFLEHDVFLAVQQAGREDAGTTSVSTSMMYRWKSMQKTSLLRVGEALGALCQRLRDMLPTGDRTLMDPALSFLPVESLLANYQRAEFQAAIWTQQAPQPSFSSVEQLKPTDEQINRLLTAARMFQDRVAMRTAKVGVASGKPSMPLLLQQTAAGRRISDAVTASQITLMACAGGDLDNGRLGSVLADALALSPPDSPRRAGSKRSIGSMSMPGLGSPALTDETLHCCAYMLFLVSGLFTCPDVWDRFVDLGLNLAAARRVDAYGVRAVHVLCESGRAIVLAELPPNNTTLIQHLLPWLMAIWLPRFVHIIVLAEEYADEDGNYAATSLPDAFVPTALVSRLHESRSGSSPTDMKIAQSPVGREIALTILGKRREDTFDDDDSVHPGAGIGEKDIDDKYDGDECAAGRGGAGVMGTRAYLAAAPVLKVDHVDDNPETTQVHLLVQSPSGQIALAPSDDPTWICSDPSAFAAVCATMLSCPHCVVAVPRADALARVVATSFAFAAYGDEVQLVEQMPCTLLKSEALLMRVDDRANWLRQPDVYAPDPMALDSPPHPRHLGLGVLEPFFDFDLIDLLFPGDSADSSSPTPAVIPVSVDRMYQSLPLRDGDDPDASRPLQPSKIAYRVVPVPLDVPVCSGGTADPADAFGIQPTTSGSRSDKPTPHASLNVQQIAKVSPLEAVLHHLPRVLLVDMYAHPLVAQCIHKGPTGVQVSLHMLICLMAMAAKLPDQGVAVAKAMLDTRYCNRDRTTWLHVMATWPHESPRVMRMLSSLLQVLSSRNIDVVGRRNACDQTAVDLAVMCGAPLDMIAMLLDHFTPDDDTTAASLRSSSSIPLDALAQRHGYPAVGELFRSFTERQGPVSRRARSDTPACGQE